MDGVLRVREIALAGSVMTTTPLRSRPVEETLVRRGGWSGRKFRRHDCQRWFGAPRRRCTGDIQTSLPPKGPNCDTHHEKPADLETYRVFFG